MELIEDLIHSRQRFVGKCPKTAYYGGGHLVAFTKTRFDWNGLPGYSLTPICTTCGKRFEKRSVFLPVDDRPKKGG